MDKKLIEKIKDIVEDHMNPDLLFVGTELGVFFSYNGGEEWKQLKAGLPTVAVRDLEIQERENDLVLATFGRSFYVLDDFSSLISTVAPNFISSPLSSETLIISAKPVVASNSIILPSIKLCCSLAYWYSAFSDKSP